MNFITEYQQRRHVARAHPEYDLNLAAGSPFDLNNGLAYQRWREHKLAHYPRQAEALLVPVANPLALSATEQRAILQRCERANMAIFQTEQNRVPDKSIPRSVAAQFGLTHIDNHLCVDGDGMSPLHVSENRVRREYIPYTNRPINWHTDGYYNADGHDIHGMVLYCVHPALEGGENALLDHEIAYIHLRDTNPDYIRAFMQNDVMTIPANDLHGEIIRPEQSGPVFSVNAKTGSLHMRFSARAHNIVWKRDRLTQLALVCLLEFLQQDEVWVIRHTLKSGQGLICNNVLHNRSGFVDGEQDTQKRYIYRARYYDRIYALSE